MEINTREDAIAFLRDFGKRLGGGVSEATPYRPGERVYAEGATIPGSGYTLVRRYPCKAGKSGKGLVRCNSCGVERVGFYAQIADARSSGCAECRYKRSRKPRLCRSCGTTDEGKFSVRAASECARCNRRALRNGRDADGKAIYRTHHAGKGSRPWAQKVTRRWAKCGRPVPCGDTSGMPHPCGAPLPGNTGACLVVTTRANCSTACRNRRASKRREQRGRKQ